jgi:predicted SAM-dependent methyltransferase
MLKLHVGCGPIYMMDFYNIDLRTDVKTDYCGSIFDINTIENDSVDFIWSCHMLEHLDYPNDTVKALELFYKWLKPGSGIRLALPDMELIMQYYMNNSKKLFQIFGDSVDDKYYKLNSKAERMLFFMRGWEHKIVFDFELIKELLEDAGFKNVKKMGFNKSDLQDWADDRYPMESLYVEAIK